MLKVQALVPSAYNPNVMSPEKYQALVESIRTDGFIEPVVVQKSGMNIIGGHHRVRAIKEICATDGIPLPKIPCIVLDVPDSEAKKINLKLQLHGEPDAKLLGDVLADIFPHTAILDDAEVAKLGFATDEAASYIRLVEPERFPMPPSGPPDGFARSVTLSLEFDSLKERDRVKDILRQRCEVEKKKSGDVIAEILNTAAERRKARK